MVEVSRAAFAGDVLNADSVDARLRETIIDDGVPSAACTGVICKHFPCCVEQCEGGTERRIQPFSGEFNRIPADVGEKPPGAIAVSDFEENLVFALFHWQLDDIVCTPQWTMHIFAENEPVIYPDFDCIVGAEG